MDPEGEDSLDQVLLALGSAVIGGLVSGVLTILAAFAAAGWQLRKTAVSARDAHLRYLRSEFEYNRAILNDLFVYTNPGPPIEHAWSPAERLATSLLVEGWDNLVRAGVLVLVKREHQQILSQATLALRDVRRVIEEVAALWPRIIEWEAYDKAPGQGVARQQTQKTRIIEWEAYDKAQGTPSLASVRLLLASRQPEVKNRVQLAIERTDEAIQLLRALVPDN